MLSTTKDLQSIAVNLLTSTCALLSTDAYKLPMAGASDVGFGENPSCGTSGSFEPAIVSTQRSLTHH